MRRTAAWVGISVIALTFAHALHAQSKRAPNQPTPQPAPNGPTLMVDTEDSRSFIKVTRSNRLGHDHGVEGKLSYGKLVLGSGGKLIFDMRSFNADTPRARKYVGLDADFADASKVTNKMRSMQVLDVQRFPQAVYDINSLKPADNQVVGAVGRYMLDGQFTLHGRNRRLQLLTELRGTDAPGVFRMTGWFKIMQTDYGIKPFSVMVGTVGIEDELTIYGDLVLRLDQGR
jgi:hypothetical protein